MVSNCLGVYTATLTPLNKDFTVDHGALKTHCQWLLDQGSTGLVLLGTTGEANSFSVRERMDILEKIAKNRIPADRLMVGTGCCAYTDTDEFSRHASSIGVGGLPLSYWRQYLLES